MSQLFNNDVRSMSQNSNPLGSLKCREHVETLLEAGMHLQHTIFQIKKLKKSMPGKLSKTTTMSFLPNNHCLTTTENHLSANNDSFIKRIQNQSLLRDFSISSLNHKEDREKKKSACEQMSLILKEAYPQLTSKSGRGLKRSTSNHTAREEQEPTHLKTISEVEKSSGHKSTSKSSQRLNRSFLPQGRTPATPSRTPDVPARDQTEGLLRQKRSLGRQA